MAAAGKIKGTGMVGVVRALRHFREQAARLLPASLSHYLDTRIVVGAWYPETDYFALMEVFMRIRPSATWEGVGTIAARDALSTVYKNVIVEGDVAETARRMRVNWRNYHDTGELSVENQPHTVRVTLAGYCLVSPLLCRLNEAYFTALIEMAGCTVTARNKLRCRARNDAACVWAFDWRAR